MKQKTIFLVLLGTAFLGRVYAAPAAYVVDAKESEVGFDAASTGHRFSGWTQDMEGSLVFDSEAQRLAEGAIVRIPVEALTTGIPARDHAMQHMFEMRRFPDIAFHIERVERIENASSGSSQKYKVDGKLLMHGVEKALSFDADVLFEGDHALAAAETPLDITEFGLKPPSFLGLFRVNPDILVRFRTVWRIKT